MIFMIFIGADLMNAALALTQVPAQLASWSRARACRPGRWWRPSCSSTWCWAAVMDELSMILLTIPIFFPMIMGLDFGMPKEIRGHLVRHPGADDGGFRPAVAAGRAERLCGQRHGQATCPSPRATAAWCPS
jgi:hypothetical protein